MTRKVSLWIVIALVGALAATTAAVVVLATDDNGDGRVAADLPAGGPWHQTLEESGEGPVGPGMGGMKVGRDDGRDASLLPWVLFALACGTAVGLLVAWSPWRGTPAPAASGPTAAGEDLAAPPTTVAEPVTAAVFEAEETIDVATETTAEAAEAVAPEADATEEAPPAS